MDTTGVLHWLDLGADKAFARMQFVEGQTVWIYVAKEASRVVSVMYYAGEKIEDLPKLDPVVL